MKLRILELLLIPRAVGELALARLMMTKLSGREIASMAFPGSPEEGEGGSEPPASVQCIAYLMPRIASRLPFRSDCLVQALAARHWLKKLGLESRLHFGAREQDGKFVEAHAWLTCGGFVVTGGDTNRYSPFQAAADTERKRPKRNA